MREPTRRDFLRKGSAAVLGAGVVGLDGEGLRGPEPSKGSATATSQPGKVPETASPTTRLLAPHGSPFFDHVTIQTINIKQLFMIPIMTEQIRLGSIGIPLKRWVRLCKIGAQTISDRWSKR